VKTSNLSQNINEADSMGVINGINWVVGNACIFHWRDKGKIRFGNPYWKYPMEGLGHYGLSHGRK
jgi:hypothetical protein